VRCDWDFFRAKATQLLLGELFLSLLLSLKVSQETVFFQHAAIFVGFTALEPPTLVDALSVE